MVQRETQEKFVDVSAAKLDSIVRQHLGNDRKKSLYYIHNLHDPQNGNLYYEIIDMMRGNNFRKIFEKVYPTGERHILMRRSMADDGRTLRSE